MADLLVMQGPVFVDVSALRYTLRKAILLAMREKQILDEPALRQALDRLEKI